MKVVNLQALVAVGLLYIISFSGLAKASSLSALPRLNNQEQRKKIWSLKLSICMCLIRMQET
jgi:hypothetical protein